MPQISLVFRQCRNQVQDKVLSVRVEAYIHEAIHRSRMLLDSMGKLYIERPWVKQIGIIHGT